jgi:flagellar biosynthesis protein FliQ
LTVFLVTLLIAMPWMFTQLMDYTTSLLGNLSRFAH